MKIISSNYIRRKLGDVIKDLEDEKVIMIANETFQEKSFIIVKPSVLTNLDDESLFKLRKEISDALEQISKKVSIKYKKIRSKREEK